MIITEIIEDKTLNPKHTYSDKGFRIKQEQTGIIYDEAYDVLESNYTYSETEEQKNEDNT